LGIPPVFVQNCPDGDNILVLLFSRHVPQVVKLAGDTLKIRPFGFGQLPRILFFPQMVAAGQQITVSRVDPEIDLDSRIGQIRTDQQISIERALPELDPGQVPVNRRGLEGLNIFGQFLEGTFGAFQQWCIQDGNNG